MTRQDTPLEREYFLVAPRAQGPEGGDTLARFYDRVRAIPDATVSNPAASTGKYVEVGLPMGTAEALRSEFGEALIFEPNAPLGY
jgi:hypothetical protein